MKNIDNMKFEERLDTLLTSNEPVQYKDWDISKEIKEDKPNQIFRTNFGKNNPYKNAPPHNKSKRI